MTVTLKPMSARFKQLIRAHGATWAVIGQSTSLQCFDGAEGILVESLDGAHSRWVKPTWIQATATN